MIYITNRVKSLAWRRCHFKTCLLNFFLPKKPTNSFTILDFFLFLWSFFLYFTTGSDLFRGQGTVFSTQISLVCSLLTEIWINNWIVFKESTGSIVRLKAGSLSCKLVKQVSQQCAGVVPKSFHLDHRGLHRNGNNLCYSFDGDTRGDWPMWDSLC